MKTSQKITTEILGGSIIKTFTVNKNSDRNGIRVSWKIIFNLNSTIFVLKNLIAHVRLIHSKYINLSCKFTQNTWNSKD